MGANQHKTLYRYDVKTFDGEDFVDAEAYSALMGRYNDLVEQYKHLENELDDMTGQFCNEAIHLTRAEDRVRELEEQNEALREFYLAWRDVQSGIIDFDLHRAAVDRLEAAEEALRGRISFSAANASEPVEATQGPSTDGNPSSHPGSEASVPASEPEAS